MALLHIVIGAIAVALVLGAPGQAEPTGAIEQLAANAWGPAVMWAGFVACAGLSLWQLSEATLRARRTIVRQRSSLLTALRGAAARNRPWTRSTRANARSDLE